MKKVLILAYDFPPYVSVGGLRPYNWYQYLKDFDVEPIVVTRQWENKFGSEVDYVTAGSSNKTIIENTSFGTILKSPYFPNLANKIFSKHGNNKYVLIRRFITLFYEIFQYLFIVGPKKEIYKTADTYLQNNKVDCIIATGDPFVLFYYAKLLSKKYNIPWIADYRDPWTDNFNNSFLIKNWYRFHEKRILKTVSKITTVSEFLKLNISKLCSNKDIFIVNNGYDPTIIDELATFPQNNEILSIGYAGTIYNWHPVEIFLKSINEVITKNINFKFTINFYGINNKEEIQSLIHTKFKNLKSYVNFYNRMSNKDLLTKLASDNVLLLFNYYSFMGTKIYDYLGIKRKILLCFTEDKDALKLKEIYYNTNENDSPNLNMQADLIKETNSGIIIKNQEDLKATMINLINEFEKNKFIECNSQNTQQFSRKLQTKKLADIIKK
jgi:hypothetical protein